jgi:pyridoxal phosphate enzyme (YggS family)
MPTPSPLEEARIALSTVNEQIDQACARYGRPRAQVRLVAAAKTVSAPRLRAFLEAGLVDVGENYVQEGVGKRSELASFDRVNWHLIGALQRNKAREAVESFGCVHSLDRAPLALALEKEAARAEKVLSVLLQVNIGDEESKAGCAPDELPALFEAVLSCSHLRVHGLMTLPPPREGESASRADFARLRQLRDALQERYGEDARFCTQLSMGMSGDFAWAIAEGATIVRVGTKLFGAR